MRAFAIPLDAVNSLLTVTPEVVHLLVSAIVGWPSVATPR